MKKPLYRSGMSLAIIGLLGTAIIVASAAVTAQDRGAGMKISAVSRPPKIIAVRVHHDLCPYCKQLEPQYAELIRRAKDESVLFVTLDLSSETSQRQSALLAGALGLKRVWPRDLSTLGTVTFVDGKSKRVISSFRAIDAETMRAFDAEELHGRLLDAVKSLKDKQ